MARDSVYGDVDGIPLSSVMFRRDVFFELGGYDTSFVHGEDMDLLVRMRERGIEYQVLPEIVLYRRYQASSLTGGRPPHEPLLRSLRAKLEREQPPRKRPAREPAGQRDDRRLQRRAVPRRGDRERPRRRTTSRSS